MKNSEWNDETTLPEGWQIVAGRLCRSFTFKDFKEAFAFMLRVSFEAELMNHHPNWSNVYHQVEVELYTHSMGKIGPLDVELAKRMNAIWDVMG